MQVFYVGEDGVTDEDPLNGDKRFAIGPVDIEITPHATAAVVDHPNTFLRIAQSRANDKRFYTTTMCYDDAMDFIDGVRRSYERQNKSVKHWRLVHGILVSKDVDIPRWGHAWVERGDTVYESCFYKGERVYCMRPKDQWYAWWTPEHTVSYTVPEAYKNMATCDRKGAGPWDSRIFNLGNHYLPLKPFK